LKSAEELDGDRPRTDLPNWDKTFPTKSLSNGIELGFHTCPFQNSHVEFPCVGEDSILEDDVGLSLSFIPQVDEGGVNGIHFFGLWRRELLLFLMLHRHWAWCGFGARDELPLSREQRERVTFRNTPATQLMMHNKQNKQFGDGLVKLKKFLLRLLHQ
jgi:hypothetical protein